MNMNKRAKRAVAIAKTDSLTELAESLVGSDGRNKMFKMAKQIKKEKKDLVGCKFVKGIDDSVKVEDTEIRRQDLRIPIVWIKKMRTQS